MYLKKGAKAPFEGHLVSKAAMAVFLANYNATIKKLETEVAYCKKVNKQELNTAAKVCEVKVSTETKKIKLCNDTRKAEKVIYVNAIERTSKQCDRKWYDSPHLWTAIGAGVCATVVGVSR